MVSLREGNLVMVRRPSIEEPSIGARVVLRQIIINLPPHEPPQIIMSGDVTVSDPRVGRVSEARVVTHYMTDAGRAFIASMTEAFPQAPPAKRGND